MAFRKESLLWRIQHPNTPDTSYLFGTMHLRGTSSFPAWERACAALAACELYAPEIDLHASSDFMGEAQAPLPEGYRLETALGTSAYKRMRGIWHRALGLNLDLYVQLHPAVLHTVFTGVLLGGSEQHMPDHALWKLAGDWGKAREGIETVNSQVQLLQSIPIDYYVQSLKDASRNITSFRNRIERLNHLYESECVQALYQTTRRDLGAMRGAMLFSRNRLMAHRIDHLCTRQTTLAAVGAAHLGGHKGVLALLKRRGLRLTAV